MKVEPIVRMWVESPKRWWIAIIGTVLVALIVLQPAVDDYTAQAARRDELTDSLRVARQEVGTRERVVVLAGERQRELSAYEQKAFSPDEVQRLRNQLVQLVRESGCQMRHIRVVEPVSRPWMKEDHPLEANRQTDPAAATPFELRTQQLSLSLTGSVAEIAQFLRKLSENDRLMHATSFQLQRSSTDGKTAILQLELVLFDLAKAGQAAT